MQLETQPSGKISEKLHQSSSSIIACRLLTESRNFNKQLNEIGINYPKIYEWRKFEADEELFPIPSKALGEEETPHRTRIDVKLKLCLPPLCIISLSGREGRLVVTSQLEFVVVGGVRGMS
jgi:hypothetical protein